jgi:anti-sigma factor ChrR (cupin superfamily)
VKDTTVVHVDTTIHVDTTRVSRHAPERVSDSAGRAGLSWGRAPAGLPEGARAAVVRGDPTKPAPFVMRADLPAGYEVPPHWHPTSEKVRVLEGTLLMGRGRQWRTPDLQAMNPGAVGTIAARQPHYVQAKTRALIEIQSVGPFEITYVNPKDDPRLAPIQH